MHVPRVVHACTFLDVNVNADVNDFVIDTWLLSLRNRKLACISLVCTSVDLGFATFIHPNRSSTLEPDGSYRYRFLGEPSSPRNYGSPRYSNISLT